MRAFCTAHRDALGQPYLVRRGRDGSHLQQALALYDEATVLRALPSYFADRRSIDRVGASIPLFVGRVAVLAGAAPADLEDFTGHGHRAATETTKATP
jgi:hypothetical protein